MVCFANDAGYIVPFTIAGPNLLNGVQGFRKCLLKQLVGAVFLSLQSLDLLSKQGGDVDDQRVEK